MLQSTLGNDTQMLEDVDAINLLGRSVALYCGPEAARKTELGLK